MQLQTARWIKKAEADWLAAQRLVAEPQRLNDVICFHGQQTAEEHLRNGAVMTSRLAFVPVQRLRLL